MSLSLGTRNYLARKWYMEELGRIPKASEQEQRAQIIAVHGVDVAFSGIYDSAEAAAYRKSVGRKI